MNNFNEDLTVKLLKEYYSNTRFVSHQIDTYNDFITKGMQAIVNREPEIKITGDQENESTIMILKFGHVYVDKPKFVVKERINVPLFPNDARQRNISYEGTIFASLKIINLETNQTIIHNQVPIGKIPIMLRSNACNLSENNRIENKECSNDYGGYFIIKGKERVLIGQLRRAYNRVYVECNPDDKFKYLAEIRSTNVQGNSILIQLKINVLTHEFFFSLPYIKLLIPAGRVFKALGISENDMIKYCNFNTNINEKVKQVLIDQFNMDVDKNDAILSISQELEDETKDFEYIKTILNKELFYHLGELTPQKSARHLGYMVKKLKEVVYEKRMIDDKDNLANKRLDSTSSLIAFLFQGLFKQFTKTISNQLKVKKNNNPDPINVIKSINNITHGLNMSFMTGNWNTQKSSSFTRVGVSQVLSMQNYGAKMSHLRRIMLPIGKKGKNPRARHLHSSHFSFICPYETPEGDTVGIVLNLALSSQISVDVDQNQVERIIKKMGEFIENVDHKVLIIINGNIIGSCDNGSEFYKSFNKYRCSDLIDNTVSIIWIKDENEIHIQTDEGRLLRPLFAIGERNSILYKKNSTFSWNDHVLNNNIVFRDVWELEQSIVAMTEEDLKKNKCDYLEINPAATMMGVMASVIPLSNHSQSPRNAYQSSMGKQAIGIPSEAFQYRYDTTLHVLDSLQQPLTKNEMVNILHFNEMPHGSNPIVAIMTYTGFNQEDSVILNKSSIDRGLFTSTTYKTIMEEEKKRGNTDFESICLPKDQYRNRNYDYSLLNETGLVWQKNVWLKKGVVIIGKTNNKSKIIKNEENNKEERILETVDVSVSIKHGEEGYLDSVLDTITNEGVRIIKIRIRIPRIPEIGDKFASSTAQKGTCGMIYRQEDMPFDKNGITPDLIINPHAIPSRMTINMLIEMCFNLIGCKLGLEMDATPFKHNNIEKELATWAEKAGLQSYTSTMYSGFTGEQLPEKIFMAPCFYQRLKHMVVDKIHARVAGPLDTLTHQPVAGRARDGGLRFGEMEKDCMLSHGSTRILKECLFDKSDKYVIPICMDCGNVPDKRTYCNLCDDNNIEMKNMPYATKLLYQELIGMGLKLKIN